MSSLYNKAVNFIYPGAKEAIRLSQEKTAILLQKQELLSNTFIQSTIYYNAYYSLMYFFLNILCLRWKILNFTGWRAEGVTLAVFILWCCAEPFRLYSAYNGNLHENVPSLVAFTFLTIFPQFGCCIYMIFIQQPMLPIDKILNIIMFFLLVIEVITSYMLTNNIIKWWYLL